MRSRHIHPLSYPICEGLSLAVPVVQAALGPCDTFALAGAVSRAGGLGTLSLPAPVPDSVARQLTRLRGTTRRPVLVAFTAQWERDEILDICIANGIRHFQVSWWNGPRLAPRIRAAGGRIFWQVNTVGDSHEARTRGADVLLVQGHEAGGPVRGPLPLADLVAELAAAGTISHDLPFVAGGGLADRQDVQRVLDMGARAALLGTRFLLSHESSAPANHKARLVRACERDLILDARLVGEWPCAPRRRLNYERAKDVPSLYAGYGLGRMGRVQSVAEIMRGLAPR